MHALACRIVLLLALACPTLAEEAPAPKQPVKAGTPATSPEQELISLGERGMAAATSVLKSGAQLPPFAFVMRADGTTQRVAASERSASHEKLVATLENDLRAAAEEGRYKAVAILADVVIALPDGTRSDAILVGLEHRAGSCRNVFHPYTRSDEGTLSFQKPISGARAGKVFAACD